MEATSSCESAVDMIAARTAERKSPAIHGLNWSWTSVRNTVSGLASGSSMYAMPTSPMRTAAPSEMITQVIAMRRATGISLAERMPMNRARMCGCPG